MSAVAETAREFYAAKRGAHLSLADADALGAVMERLEVEGRGTPAALVEEARDPTSPIHHLFTWDLSEAAAAYWVEQARRYYRIIVRRKEFPDGHSEEIRAFHVVRLDAEDDLTDGEEGNRYVGLRVLRDRPDLVSQVLAQARAELRAFNQKYKHYRFVFSEYEETFGQVHVAIEEATKEP